MLKGCPVSFGCRSRKEGSVEPARTQGRRTSRGELQKGWVTLLVLPITAISVRDHFGKVAPANLVERREEREWVAYQHSATSPY